MIIKTSFTAVAIVETGFAGVRYNNIWHRWFQNKIVDVVSICNDFENDFIKRKSV